MSKLRNELDQLYVGTTTPVSSEGLNWNGLNFSYLQNVAPQTGVEETTNHLVVIHTTSEPVLTLEKYEGYRNEGVARPGDMNIISAGETTFCRWDNPLSFIRLEFSPRFFQQLAAQTELVNPTRLEIAQKFRHHDDKILQISHWLLDELQNGNPGGKLYTDSLTNVLAIHLLRNYTTSSVKTIQFSGHLSQPQVVRAIEYMHANLSQNITLEELAFVTGTSPTYLVRLFKNTAGLAPHQYLINLRVQKARELLTAGKQSISEIAAIVGFADQSHLHRHLKRLLGVTPKSLLPSIR